MRRGTLCALAALFVSCATPGADEPRKHAVVQVSFESLRPETVRIPADGNVTWVNLAPDSRAFVVFPETASPAFTCGEDLDPYFRKIPGGYQSLPITDFESRIVRLPCALKPGSHAYEIWIMGAGLGQTDASGPERKLQGKIIVE